MSDDRDLTYRIMQIMAGPEGADYCLLVDDISSELFLTPYKGRLRWSVNCNDQFEPAADSEEITAENVELLAEAVDDVRANGLYERWGILFAVKVRRRKPWKYDRYNPLVRALIDQYLAAAAVSGSQEGTSEC